MRKRLLAVTLASCSFLCAFAQEKNPLVNSGEIINEAIKLHDDGKYKEAIALYKKINRSDTNYVRALYEASLSYSADSQFNAALETCKLALAEKTDLDKVPDLLTQYGSLLDNIGEPEKSLHVFDSAIRLFPTHSLLYLNKGTTLLGMKKYQEAEKVFQYAIIQDPYVASCHYKLGVAALQTGKLIPAMYCFINYLLVLPGGRYSNNCISYLNNIAKNTDLITEYTEARTEDAPEEYSLVEKIIQSKIALDKNYKPLIELDDPISRQIQVLLEKTTYAADSKDFWMQYYVPYYKNVFSTGKFEPLINYIFSGVNIPQIQNYNKKNKKEIEALTTEAGAYFNLIRVTRQLNYSLRATSQSNYYYDNGKLSGMGKSDPKTGKSVGEWTFYYPAGNIKSHGIYNEKGERQGKWTYYYMNGSVRATQDFTGEKLNGNEKYYFLGGNISSDANYKDDKQEAEGRSYYYAGANRIIANYANNKLNGGRKQFYSSGQLKSSENFTDDKLNGPFITYFKNGLHESEGMYVNDALDGPYKAWFDNGQLSIDGQYVKDKETGTWKRYHENGQLKSTQTYVNGKEESEYTEYFDNGKLFTKYNYKKAVITGDVVYNDDDGKPFSVFVFDNGKPVSARYLDKSGKEISTSAFKEKKMDLVSYYPDGNKKSQLLYNSKGNAEGTEKIYYHNGKLFQTNEYTDGQLNGASSSYYLNEKMTASVNYNNGKKDGYYKSYFTNGATQSEGWYKDNLAEGSWLNYDELGNLLAINYFFNDELDGHKEEFYLNGKKEYDTKYHRGWIEDMIQYDTAGNIINTVKIQKGSGRFNGYHLNGKLKFESDYVNGDFDGPYKFYFFDGSPNVTRFYKKGEPDSIYKSYFYGGQLYADGQFKLGKKHGTWKYYKKNGKLNSTEEYLNGELSGHSITYFDNGKIELDISYTDGERNGETKKYEPGGNLVFQIMYKGDLPYSYTYLAKDGKLAPDIAFAAGSGKIKTFYPNGQLATEHAYAEGKINGVYKLYFPNGKLWVEREDSYSITNGPIKQYYENGQLKSLYTYLNDNIHGPYKEYNEKGIVIEEGNFYNGNYHGDVKLYNDNGKLTETDVYYYGNLLTVKK